MPPEATARPWIFGPAPDLLLGCGLGYALLAAGLALLPVETNDLLRWGVLATFVTGMPHYGATLVRVYERQEDRRRYVFFTLWASLAVWLCFVAGVHHLLLGSLLATVYVNWSPWHYAGQNYGLAVMFLRRRRVEMAPALKRPLYASFLLSFLLTFLTINGGLGAAGYVPQDLSRANYNVLSLGIPAPIYRACLVTVAAAYAASLLLFGVQLARRTRLRGALPVLLLIVTQAAWFSAPALVLFATGVRIQDEYILFYFLWAGIAHSVQYLWITTYYAAGSGSGRDRLVFLGKALLAGGMVFAVPALLFAPGLLGVVPYETGLWLLIAAAVNLQHFILDGAIWKLRDGPVARILLGRSGAAAAPNAPLAGSWPRRVIWGAAAAATALAIGSAAEYELGWIAATERGDDDRAARAELHLTAIGRDNPLFYQRRAGVAAGRGDLGAAVAEYERSLSLFPTPDAWYALGVLRARGGDAAAARAAFESSLALEPTKEAWTGLGTALQLEGDAAAAGEAFENALRLDAGFVPALHMAGRLWLEAGQIERGRSLLRRAVSIAPRDEQLASDLRRAGG